VTGRPRRRRARPGIVAICASLGVRGLGGARCGLRALAQTALVALFVGLALLLTSVLLQLVAALWYTVTGSALDRFTLEAATGSVILVAGFGLMIAAGWLVWAEGLSVRLQQTSERGIGDRPHLGHLIPVSWARASSARLRGLLAVFVLLTLALLVAYLVAPTVSMGLSRERVDFAAAARTPLSVAPLAWAGALAVFALTPLAHATCRPLGLSGTHLTLIAIGGFFGGLVLMVVGSLGAHSVVGCMKALDDLPAPLLSAAALAWPPVLVVYSWSAHSLSAWRTDPDGSRGGFALAQARIVALLVLTTAIWAALAPLLLVPLLG